MITSLQITHVTRKIEGINPITQGRHLYSRYLFIFYKYINRINRKKCINQEFLET